MPARGQSNRRRKRKQSSCTGLCCIGILCLGLLLLLHLHYRVAVLHSDHLEQQAKFNVNPDAEAYLKAAQAGKLVTGSTTAANGAETTAAAEPVHVAISPLMDKKYTLFDKLTWDLASPACKIRGKQLCSFEEVCPHGKGKFPAVASLKGDHWLPVRDEPNSWVATGDLYQDRVCKYHQECCGVKPEWGLAGNTGIGGSVILCCGKSGEPAPGGAANGLKFVVDPEMGTVFGGKYVKAADGAAAGAAAAKAAGAGAAAATGAAKAGEGVQQEFDAFFHSLRVLRQPKTPTKDKSVASLTKMYETSIQQQDKHPEQEGAGHVIIVVAAGGVALKSSEAGTASPASVAAFDWERVEQVSAVRASASEDDMEIAILDLVFGGGTNSGGAEGLPEGEEGVLELQLEVNDARGIRQAMGETALGKGDGSLADATAYDVSVVKAAGAKTQAFDVYVREPAELKAKAAAADKEAAAAIVVDSKGIHVQLPGKAKGGAAVGADVLASYGWEVVNQVTAVRASKDPSDMELLVLEVLDKAKHDQGAGALAVIPTARVLFEVDDARKVRKSIDAMHL
eukprot:g172.t1